MSNRIETGSLPAGTTIRIGCPAEQPEEAIAALRQLFSETENVTSARLGLMETLHPDGTSEFTYTIGIQCSSAEGETLAQALEVLQTVPSGRWPITLMLPTKEFFTNDAMVFFRRGAEPRSWFSRLFRSK